MNGPRRVDRPPVRPRDRAATPASDEISVVLAEDHALTRFAIRRALEDDRFSVCAEASDASGAVEAALRERPEICLLDLHMPGNALEAVDAITSHLPGTTVVMLTVSRSDPDLFDALCAGAAGYVATDIEPERIPLALHGVLAGDIAFPRGVVKRLVEEFRTRGARPRIPLVGNRAARLTEREWEVLELLRQGCKTGEIARRLFISQGTVRSHIRSIVKKLRVPDRNAAIRLLEETLRPGSR